MEIELSTHILLVQDNPPFLRCLKNVILQQCYTALYYCLAQDTKGVLLQSFNQKGVASFFYLNLSKFLVF